MWRSSFFPKIHEKHSCMWNNSYGACTECWQKTSDLRKGKLTPTSSGRETALRKKRDQGKWTGPAPRGGSWEGGKVSAHSQGCRDITSEGTTATGAQKAKQRELTRDRCL